MELRGGQCCPVNEEQRHVDHAILKRVAERTPTYKTIGPFSKMEGNCSTGAATLLRMAEVLENEIMVPSPGVVGLHHEIKTRNPVKGEPARARPAKPGEEIDYRSMREGEIDTTALTTALNRKFSQPIDTQREEQKQVLEKAEPKAHPTGPIPSKL